MFGSIVSAPLLGISAPASLTVVAFTLLIGATLGVIFTTRTTLENILYNCFWGAGKMYGYWGEERGSIQYQLAFVKDEKSHDSSIRRLLIESQEFINLFYMPALEIVGKQTLLILNLAMMKPFTINLNYQDLNPDYLMFIIVSTLCFL